MSNSIYYGNNLILNTGDLEIVQNLTLSESLYEITATPNIPEDVEVVGDYVFYGMRFTTVYIPYSVEELGELAFAVNSALTTVNMSPNITVLGEHCFMNCSRLVNVNIPPGVKDIPLGLFRRCDALPFIIIPEVCQSIGAYAFDSCSALSAVYFRCTPPSVASRAFDTDNFKAYIPSPASSELLLHLSAQGSTTSSISAANGVIDISGRGNHGQAYNGVTVTTTADYGDAFGFPNNNSYIDLIAKKDTIFTQGNAYTFTVSFYITEKPTRANGVLVMWVYSVPCIQVWLTSDYKIQIRSDNSFAAYTASDAIALNTFYNVTVSCNYLEGTRTVYINGQAVATATRTAGALTLNVTYMVLGNHKGSTGYNLPGYITDARIYGKALSPTEVSRLYKSVQWTPKIKSSTYGRASSVTWAAVPTSPILALDPLTSATGSNGIKDISGNGYHGTISGTASINTSDNTFVFDGASSSKVDVTNSSFLSAVNGKTALTLSMAAKCTNSGKPRAGGLVSNTSTGYVFSFLYFTETSVTFHDRLSSSSETIKSLTTSIVPGVYHTATATVDYTNGIAILYIDGVEKVRSTDWFKGTKANVSAFRLGQNSTQSSSGYQFQGSIKNVRVYDRALTPAEVAALHDNSKSIPTAGTQVQIAPANTATSATYAIANAVYMRHGTLKKLVVGDYGTTYIKIYDLDGTRSSGTYTDFDYSTSNIDIAMAIAEDDEGCIYITGANTGYIVKLQVCSRVVNGQINYYLEKLASMRLGSLVAANQVTYCKARDAIMVIGWSSGGSRSYCFQISKDFSSVINIANWSLPSMGGCFTLDGKRLFLSTYSSNNRFGYIDFSSASDTDTKTSYTYADTPTGYSPNINSGNNDARYATAGIDGYMYFQMLNGSVLKYTTDGQYVAKIGDTGSVPTSGSYSTPRHDGVCTYDEHENALVYPKADGTICRMYL